MLDPKEFQDRFIEWAKAACGKQTREIFSIDGKTMRGSKSTDKKPIHIVSAWANKARAVFGQLATDEKSNEITAVPELLELLDIEGTIITADAMSCQRKIVKKISGKGADYVINLKGNQSALHDAVREHFDTVMKNPELFQPLSILETVDNGHGRIEKRTYYLCTDAEFLDLYRSEWENLNAIGMRKTCTEQKGKLTEEISYFIASITDIKEFADSSRAHWGVESSLHWCLDVTFREDHSRMRKDHSAENFAVIRHIVLNILKMMDDKMSVARRRRHCAYDDVYLEKVIAKMLESV